jgi:hypothetical protein
MRGKYRTGTYCGDNFCPCKKYKDKESEIGVGTIFIRGKMDKDLTMKGNRYWVAHGASFSGLNFTIDYVGDKPVLKPKPLDKVGKSILNVTVSWEFKASRQD